VAAWHAWQAHNAAFRRDAFEQRFIIDPVTYQRASSTHLGERDCEQLGALFEDPLGDPFVDDAAADADLLFGGKEQFLQDP
jgi:hypothetical protein